MRSLVRKYRELDDASALELLASSWHEERLVALLLLVQGYRRGDESRRTRIHRAYLANTRHINNWDLVDVSAEHIVGLHLDGGDITLLESLAGSEVLWERRIAIVATFHFIKRNEFRPTLKIAGLLLRDSHDLIHKAVGWMLREVGKRDRRALDDFLRNTISGCRARCCGMRSSDTRSAFESSTWPGRYERSQNLAGTL